MKKVSWLFGSLGFGILGLGVLAAPAQWEELVLVPISPGHALSVLDPTVIVPLLTGVDWLYLGLRQRRQRLDESLHQSPDIGCQGIFIAGLGLGLLVPRPFRHSFGGG